MGHAIRESVGSFQRSPLLLWLSAAMVALALFVVGLFSIAAFNLKLALEAIEERVEVVVYVRDDARGENVLLMEEELALLPEVESIRFVSKEAALLVARNELPEFREVFTDLDVNPLPASLEIRLRRGSRTPEAVERVAQIAEVYPDVEEVRYGRDWVDRLFFLRRIGGITAGILGAAFAAVAALIIGTAVRIAVFARREEIYVMRLVGATDGFIRRPFLLEGAMTGVLGGVLAAGITFGSWFMVNRFVFELSWIPPLWVGAGIAAGGIFGFLSSGLAIRRYLREI
ncbi:MAG: permease-like cell division protein FtsX [Gemmatimonadota bacterium]